MKKNTILLMSVYLLVLGLLFVSCDININDKQYTFRDSTGEVIVEIEDEHWGNLTAGSYNNVEISGKLDKERNGKIEIEVEIIREVPAGYGPVNSSWGQMVTVSQLSDLPDKSFVVLTGSITK
jgi:uncharacterized protein YdeI (BOF family)